MLEIVDFVVKQPNERFISEPELISLLIGTTKTISSMRVDPVLQRKLVKEHVFEKLGDCIEKM